MTIFGAVILILLIFISARISKNQLNDLVNSEKSEFDADVKDNKDVEMKSDFN